MAIYLNLNVEGEGSLMNKPITIFFQNYHDDMALRVQARGQFTYFQVLRKGEVVSEMIKTIQLNKCYEIGHSKAIKPTSEFVTFKLVCVLETFDDKLTYNTVVNIDQDVISTITIKYPKLVMV